MLAVVKTYCPEKVPDLQKWVDSQNFDALVST